jgi:hypothetical protein
MAHWYPLPDPLNGLGIPDHAMCAIQGDMLASQHKITYF